MKDKFVKPTDRRYNLTCEIHLREVTFLHQDKTGERKDTQEMIFLVPREGTQRDLFLAAWLPEESCEYGQKEDGSYERPEVRRHYHEIGALGGSPISAPFRCAVFRKDKRFNDAHHIFVMSRGAEDALKNYLASTKGFGIFKRPKTVEIVVLGESETESFFGN